MNKTVRVCMFLPRGLRWFKNHDKATEKIREEHPEAVRVRRWQENGLQREDYKDKEGNVLVQLEFAGPPVLASGFSCE